MYYKIEVYMYGEWNMISINKQKIKIFLVCLSVYVILGETH